MRINFQGESDILNRRNNFERRQFNDPSFSGIDRRVSGDRRVSSDRRAGNGNKKHQRLPAGPNTFVKLYSDFSVDVGQIMDISAGGLSALTFLDKMNKDYSGLDIFLPDKKFIIKNIPCKTVAKIEIPNRSQLAPVISYKNCIKFEELTSDQNIKLDYLLWHGSSGHC